MKNIIEILKSLEDSDLLFKGVSQTIQNEAKEQKGGFLSILLGTLGASLLGNILAGKGINRAGEGVIRVGYGNKKGKKKKTTTKWVFYAALSYKNIIKMNINSMVYILKIIYPNANLLK